MTPRGLKIHYQESRIAQGRTPPMTTPGQLPEPALSEVEGAVRRSKAPPTIRHHLATAHVEFNKGLRTSPRNPRIPRAA